MKRMKASGFAKIHRSSASFRRTRFGKSSRAIVMQRPQLEHIIRAAAGITDAKEFVIIGSQAVLGQFPNSPAELLVSIELDFIFS
jgi:hypothetical protein